MFFEDTKFFKIISEHDASVVATDVLRLLKSGRDVNVKSKSGETYLHLVSSHAEKFEDERALPVVYQLSNYGIDVNAQDDDGETCLHRVLRNSRGRRVCRAMLRCGVDVSIQNLKQQTALDILNSSESPGQRLKHCIEVFTPGIYNASLSDNKTQVEKLLSCWAKVNVTQSGQRLLDDVRNHNQPINNEIWGLLQRQQHQMAFVHATLAGDVDRMKMLIKEGNCNVNTKDMLYTYFHMDATMAKPLLAEAWAQENDSVVDVLMSQNLNTGVLYKCDITSSPKPLFFQAFIGKTKPKKLSIVQRILQDSDLSERNNRGQTLLYEAVSRNLPETALEALLKLGIDLGSRDIDGNTARDFANKQGKHNYVTLFDDWVRALITSKDISKLESLVLQSYNHVFESVSQFSTDSQTSSSDSSETETKEKQGDDVIKALKKMEKSLQLVQKAMKEDDFELFKRKLSVKVSQCRDRCGRGLLHKAVSKANQKIALYLMQNYPPTIQAKDNLSRTPLHYAYALGQADIAELLLRHGASPQALDVEGNSASFYNKDVCGPYLHAKFRKSVEDFDLNIYMHETAFKKKLLKAIKVGSLETVSLLVDEVEQFTPITRFSQILFDCIDYKQEAIARYFVEKGCNVEIYKQYTKDASVAEGNTSETEQCEAISLQKRADEMQMEQLSNQIKEITGRKQGDKSGNISGIKPKSPFESFIKIGLVT